MKICKQHREGRRGGGGGGESQANNIEHKYYNLGFDREYIMKLNANIKLKLWISNGFEKNDYRS